MVLCSWALLDLTAELGSFLRRWEIAAESETERIPADPLADCRGDGWGRRAGPTKRVGVRMGAVGSESNEIPAIPALLGVLKLGGTVVTIDTMGCRTARPQPDGCNVMAPKDTHPTLHE